MIHTCNSVDGYDGWDSYDSDDTLAVIVMIVLIAKIVTKGLIAQRDLIVLRKIGRCSTSQ